MQISFPNRDKIQSAKNIFLREINYKKFLTVILELGIQYDGAIWSATQLVMTLVGLALMLDTTSVTVVRLSMTYWAVFFSSVTEPSA